MSTGRVAPSQRSPYAAPAMPPPQEPLYGQATGANYGTIGTVPSGNKAVY